MRIRLKKTKQELKKKTRYRCAFCRKIFSTCAKCAKHIQKESVAGLVNPSDIIMEIKVGKKWKGVGR